MSDWVCPSNGISLCSACTTVTDIRRRIAIVHLPYLLTRPTDGRTDHANVASVAIAASIADALASNVNVFKPGRNLDESVCISHVRQSCPSVRQLFSVINVATPTHLRIFKQQQQPQQKLQSNTEEWVIRWTECDKTVALMDAQRRSVVIIQRRWTMRRWTLHCTNNNEQRCQSASPVRHRRASKQWMNECRMKHDINISILSCSQRVKC